MMNTLLICGTGAQAQYCINAFEDKYNCIPWDIEQNNIKVPVWPWDKAIIAHGDWRLKRKVAHLIEPSQFISLVQTYIHKSSYVAPGCILNMGAIISNGVFIGRHSIVHSGAVLEHDVWLGEYVNIAANTTIGGRVTICGGAFIGLGAVILPNIIIGSGSIVGAGAVVTRNVPPNVIVKGVPAK